MPQASIGDPIPRGTLHSVSSEDSAASSPSTTDTPFSDWNELVAVGWNLAFLPALAWADLMTTSLNAWEMGPAALFQASPRSENPVNLVP
jgi:hypothetical protein